MAKAQREVAEFHRFRELGGQLIEVNEQICELRPVEGILAVGPGKKTAEAIQQEVAREVDQLLRVIFNGRRKSGHLDLEAIEMAVRSAMHHAGATALSELLQFPAPAAEQRTLPCACGHRAHYRELRSKPVLTAVGQVEVSRPYYLCPHCHAGQFPADVELDIENTEFSPGVRRMQAMVGQEAPFDHGRQQMKLLADLEVTTKAVERTAEAIGADIAAREQDEIHRAVQLDLPIVMGKPIPFLYVQMDGTGVPVVKKETVGRPGKTEGQPAHTREAKLGCVFTQTTWDEEGFAIRDPDSTTYVAAIETAEEFGKRIYLEAWKRGWSRAEKKVVHRRWSRMDLEHCRPTLPRRHSDRRSLSRPPTLVGPGPQTVSQPGSRAETLDDGPPGRLLDEGKIEDLVAALRSIDSSNSGVGRKDPHRGRLF